MLERVVHPSVLSVGEVEPLEGTQAGCPSKFLRLMITSRVFTDSHDKIMAWRGFRVSKKEYYK
jgi:hypothetical protein